MCRGFVESHEHALPLCSPPAPRPRPRTALRAVATQQWCHLPLIDGPRERLSSTGAIDGRLAPASDGRPANDPRLLAPPNETLARLLRCDSGRNAMPQRQQKLLGFRIQSCGKGKKFTGRFRVGPLGLCNHHPGRCARVHSLTYKLAVWRSAARDPRQPTTTSA